MLGEDNDEASVSGSGSGEGEYPSTSSDIHEIAQSGSPAPLGKRSKENRLKETILKDGKGVNSARWAIWTVILLGTLAICFAVFFISAEADQDTFEHEVSACICV